MPAWIVSDSGGVLWQRNLDWISGTFLFCLGNKWGRLSTTVSTIGPGVIIV